MHVASNIVKHFSRVVEDYRATSTYLSDYLCLISNYYLVYNFTISYGSLPVMMTLGVMLLLNKVDSCSSMIATLQILQRPQRACQEVSE